MSGSVSTALPADHKRTAGLALAALGVVFGDIGTSPLYTIKECFSDFTGLKPVPQDVLGILSLVTWVLIIIVALKYVSVVMRADNRGEGGVLALMTLVARRSGLTASQRNFYVMLGMAGAALFFGDALLTPTRIYVDDVERLKRACGAGLRAMAHITGEGLAGNVPRVLPRGLTAVIDRSLP